MLRVGLTGGIACGKSRVRRRLAAAGFSTLDLDAVAHDVIAPGGPAYEDVVSAFGPGILAADRTVDRRALGARVFVDGEARARLNALVHPRVRDEEARRAAAAAEAGARAFITDAALLVEAGLHLRFHRLAVVHCPAEEQVRRLMGRDGLDEAAARARMAAQMTPEEKRGFAHWVVDASRTQEETDAAADALVAEIADLADHPPPRPRLGEAALVAAVMAGPARGPRGLDPRRWVAEVAAAGGVEMERLKRLLSPPFEGPWFAAADATPTSPTTDARAPGPEALALVVGVWARARRGVDPPFTAAAMFSTARLTHRDPRRIADACLLALAAAHVAGRGRAESGDEDRAGWVATAERWSGARVSAPARAAVEAALAHPRDERAAGAAALAAGADPALAAGVVAAALALPHEDTLPELAADARAVVR